MRIGVIVTTYNRPDALSVVLDAYLAQTDQNFELLIADDGSTVETAKVIQNFKLRAPFSVVHIWHEDSGFRAAAIRNRALAASTSDYIIFTDGDCIPPANFVSQHRLLSESGWFLSGNRLLLSPNLTNKIINNQCDILNLSMGDWLDARIHGDIFRLLPLLNLSKLSWLRKLNPGRWKGAKTCNLSAFKQDLLSVNGLDESYTGWGLEDSDLVVRLLRVGIKNKSARFAAPVFHLWHKENDRSNLLENHQRLQAVLQAKHIRATQGVDQYLLEK